MFGYLIKTSIRSPRAMGRAEAETIRVLRENGEAYQSDLVRTTGFSRATISAVLADLERMKLGEDIDRGEELEDNVSGER